MNTRTSRAFKIAAGVGLLLAAAWPAAAEAPGQLTYQGRLKESGLPVTGARSVEILLCPGSTGGGCVGTGPQSVAVGNGLFRTTFTVPTSVDLRTGSFWVEVQVGATPLAPRELLTSSPYATYASSAATIVGSPWTNGARITTSVYITGGDLQVGDVTASTLSAAGHLTLANLGAAPGLARGRLYFDSTGLGALRLSLDGSTFVPIATGSVAGAGNFVGKTGDFMTGQLTIGGSSLTVSGSAAGGLGVGAAGLTGGLAVLRSTSTSAEHPVLEIQNQAGAEIFKLQQDGRVGPLRVARASGFGTPVLEVENLSDDLHGIQFKRAGDVIDDYIIGHAGTGYENGRALVLHVPTAGSYGGGAQPKIAFTGAAFDTLGSAQAVTGDWYLKGLVGIGVTNPTHKLDVGGAQIFRGSSTWTGLAAPSLSAGGQGAIYFDSGANAFRVSENGGAYIPLLSASAWTDDGTVVRLTSAGDNVVIQSTLTVQGNAFSVGGSTLVVASGQVGIGTSNPATVFHVSSGATTNVNISRFFAPSLADNNRTEIYLGRSAAAGEAGILSYKYNIVAADAGMILYNFGDTANDGITVRKGGNVAIGDVTPQSRLAVNGNAAFGAYGTGVVAPANGLVVSGNVGVGTPNPSTRLHVSGGDIQAGDLTASTLSASGFLTMARLAAPPGAAQGRLYFDPAGQGALRISLDGSTFVPIATGSVAGVGAYVNKTGDFMSGQLTVAGSSLTVTGSAAGGLGVGATNLTGGLVVFRSTTPSPSHPALAVQNQGGGVILSAREDGNVGIGVASPGAMLDVNGSLRAVGSINLLGASPVIQTPGGGMTFNTAAGGSILFQINASDRLFVKTTGDVGIGTTDPRSRLDVNGDAIIRTSATWAGSPAPTNFSPAGQGSIYFDVVANKFKVSENGLAYVDLLTGGNFVSKTGDFMTGPLTLTGSSLTIRGAPGQPYGLSVASGTSASQTILYVSSMGWVGVGTNANNDPAETSLVVGRSLSFGDVGSSVRFNIQGGMGWNSDHFIGGGTLPEPIIFAQIGASTNVVMLHGGRTGFGTGQPTARLHVSSAGAIASDTVMLVSTGAAQSQEVLTVKGDGRVGIAGASDAGARLALPVDGLSEIRFLSGLGNAEIESSNDMDLGTYGGSDLRLKTSGQQRIRIKNTGQIGIANEFPSYGLDIATAVIVRSSLTMAGMAGVLTSPGGQGTIFFDSSVNKFRVSENSLPYVDLIAAAAGGWQDDGLVVRLASPADSVVIASSLTVSGGGPATGLGVGASGLTGGLVVLRSTTTTPVTHPVLAVQNQGGGELLRVQQDGRVGIGTTAPGNLLHVSGISTFNGDVTLSAGAVPLMKVHHNSGAGLSHNVLEVFNRQGQSLNLGANPFMTFGSAGESLVTLGGLVENGVSPPPSSFIVQTNSGAGLTERMRIDSAGNTGIGTAGPGAARLDVSKAGALVNETVMQVSTGTGTGQQLIVIKGDNRVGIGTINPTHRLDVVGGAIVRSSWTMAGTFPQTISAPGQGAVYFDSGANKFKVSENNLPYVDLVPSPSGWNENLVFNSVFTQNTSRLVGVGTTGPTARLHVSSSTALAGETVMLVSTGVATGQEVLAVKGNGWVGLGTGSPGAKLHIIGTQVNDRVLFESNFSNGNPEIRVKANTPAGFATLSADRADNGSSAGLTLHTAGTTEWLFRTGISTDSLQIDNAVGSQVMTLTRGARVGIGTTNPFDLLHMEDPTGNTKLRVAGTATSGIIWKNTGGAGSPQQWEMNQEMGVPGNSLAIFDQTGGNIAMMLVPPGDIIVGGGVDGPTARFHVNKAGAVAADTLLKVSSGIAASQELMVVKGNGSVGIGTTGPTYRLDINGGAIVRSTLTMTTVVPVPPVSSGGQGAIYFDGAKFRVSENGLGYVDLVGGPTGGGWIDLGTVVRLGTAGDAVVVGDQVIRSSLSVTGAVRIGLDNVTSGTLIVRSTATDGTYPVVNVQNDAGVELMRVQQNGSVGIGSTQPSERFHMLGSGFQDILAETNDAVGQAAVLLRGTAGILDTLELIKHENGAGAADGLTFDDLGEIRTGASASGLVLRTVSNNPMWFFTNNLRRMVIDAGGNVGIATTNPIEKLHAVVAGAGQGYALVEGTGGTAQIGYRMRSPTGDWLVGMSSGVSNGDFTIRNNGLPQANQLTITNGGLTGIGTASPGAKLHLDDPSLPVEVRIGHTDVADDSILSFYEGATNRAQIRIGGNTAQHMAIDVGGLERMRIENNGNVGIGTTDPIERLHIEKTSDFSIVMKNTGANGDEWHISNIAGVGPAGGLRFYNATDTLERMRLDNDGNVGIGTTGPASRLQVAGGDLGLGDATAAGNQPVTVWLRNNSGSPRAQGDIVIAGIGDDGFDTTAASGSQAVVGVVYEPGGILAGAVGRIAVAGVALVRSNGGVTRGDHVSTAAPAGQAQSTPAPPAMGASIGVWLQTNGAAGTYRALLR